MRRTRLLLAASAASVVLVAAQRELVRDSGRPEPRTSVVVMAAASLQVAFTEIADAFELGHPDVDVVASFAGSATLVEQAAQGAPVDVIALADPALMATAVASGEVDATSVATFATNQLALIVPAGKPRSIVSLADVAGAGLSVVLCDVAQPCGKYAETVLEREGIAVSPASRELSASGVVARVASGEADAGIAYVTDAARAKGVEAVEIADALNLVAEYPIGIATTSSRNSRAAARSFLVFVLSPQGRAILAKAGFGAP